MMPSPGPGVVGGYRGLRVSLPFEIPAQGGGGYRFLRGLQRYLDQQGIAWSRRITGQVMLANGWRPSMWAVLTAKAKGMRILHRYDGANYGRTDGAEARQDRLNRWADLTVYQSEYSRAGHTGLVFHNPVDTEAFTPEGVRVLWREPHVAVVSWSDNPMKGGALVYEAARRAPSVHFMLCGRFPDPPVLDNLRLLGVLDTPALAATLRGCDALLTFSRNEACPNHVLEAMACDLPVFYLDSGATGELVGTTGCAVKEDVDVAALLPWTSLESPRARVLTHFTPEIVYPRYVEALRALCA